MKLGCTGMPIPPDVLTAEQKRRLVRAGVLTSSKSVKKADE